MSKFYLIFLKALIILRYGMYARVEIYIYIYSFNYETCLK
jgi:hypothetical protein